ncbi:uncharacterized protein CG1161-like [Uloborus diversus]|uniref:uncharacterized protein CG1161-like n=1 Tax=Uloborus diversus TaxID=327109 RepID=UPI002409C9CC|nr:uncharacterized protein CG1161-like [Uloborus diversus]XP_054716349.1 uncharacterized protein CG1161-like [Uloborus diversus]
MNYIYSFSAIFILFALFSVCDAQYEDVRCKCICPSPEVVKGNKTERKLYIANVKPSQCKCEGVVMPQADDYVRVKEKEFCPRCECRYERRNTMTIKVVVIIIIWVISLLTVYMLFLMCLDPLLNKRRTAYHEHTNEEVTLDVPMPTIPRPRAGSSNVLNRVGLQQDRWKRQVQEQRRNIYDRHTMLN